MKQLILFVVVIALLSTTFGCANGPLRRWLGGARCDPCQPPTIGVQSAGGCASGECGSSYLNDSFIQSDPYISGSNYGGAVINPPVLDSYSSPNYGSTIVAPDASGPLPQPENSR